jgi:hypothetical protein
VKSWSDVWWFFAGSALLVSLNVHKNLLYQLIIVKHFVVFLGRCLLSTPNNCVWNLQVRPEDVMDPSSPGPIFILVDCPTAAHVPALLSNPQLRMFQEQDSGIPTKQVTLIVHTSPASISGLPEYQYWMTRFAGAQHVMAGHGTWGAISTATWLYFHCISISIFNYW